MAKHGRVLFTVLNKKVMMMSDVPRHVGYILDGNRRWARQHGLPTYEGHLAGFDALRAVIDATSDAGVEYISFYTWSTENWKRAQEEVDGIMKLVRRLFKSYFKELKKKGYKMVVMGGRDQVPDDIIKMIDEIEADHHTATRATLVVCFNYGGQQEIARAARRMLEAGVFAEDVDTETFANYLDHPEVPACDLIVRTSGELRLSNFMLWRSAYSEFIFLEKYWPEMRPGDITGILEEYKKRNRRIGG
jgi:undecaprenyl diphosphate synthase